MGVVAIELPLQIQKASLVQNVPEKAIAQSKLGGHMMISPKGLHTAFGQESTVTCKKNVWHMECPKVVP